MSKEPTHKLVNGERIELTEEEKKQILADWEEGRKRLAERRAQYEEMKKKRQAVLDRLGLTEEEAKLLRGI